MDAKASSFAIALLLSGCAHTPVQRLQMDPITFQRGSAGDLEVIDPGALFDAAKTAFDVGNYSEAARQFDRLSGIPDTRYVDASLYNAGLSHEGLKSWPAAADRYRKLIARGTAPVGDQLDTRFRLAAVLIEQNLWPKAADVYEDILREKDLALLDRLEALARRGTALLNANDLDAAEKVLSQPLALYQQQQTLERIDSFFVAMSAFYLGEVAHRRYLQQPLRLPSLSDDVDQKATLLLSAEARYLEAMKVKHPEWATAAGSQVAVLYREFYDALLAVPTPGDLSPEARTVYQDEIKKQLQSLLRRALAVHEKTVLLAERIGFSNDWVKRSNAQMEELRQLLVPGAPSPPLPPVHKDPLPLPRPRDDLHPHHLL